MLKKYYIPYILEDGYKFSASGAYYAPEDRVADVYRDYIDTLTLKDNPEVFGLSKNANITYQNLESK